MHAEMHGNGNKISNYDMIRNQAPIIAIVAPCYNESLIVSSSYGKISEYLTQLIIHKTISSDSFMVFVDDGSSDNTYQILSQIQQKDNKVRVIKFSKNYGHQNAILAGMFTFYQEADCVITLDFDLQDDISIVEKMVQNFEKGHQIVYGVRSKRENDTYFKKITAEFFYKLMRFMGIELIFNHADYRLASKNVVAELTKFDETNLFLRGIFPLMGFKNSIVYYERMERMGGESKFSLIKMLSFAWDGVTSFSIKPLRMVTFVGLLIFLISLALSGFAIFSYFYLKVVPGWASIALPIYLLGGIQLLSIGIVGEYIGKIYKEVKRRPRYIIENVL